jgi:hypothetical protein
VSIDDEVPGAIFEIGFGSATRVWNLKPPGQAVRLRLAAVKVKSPLLDDAPPAGSGKDEHQGGDRGRMQPHGPAAPHHLKEAQ